ncbi:hypothetical protein [Desulfosporosinus hippei]|uniref:Uncharacterized protein n=1 Tax=Desulfosporosinus hippei DSM 8344 TaxID=1121419 RepID=A0A1G7XSZ9_9FIRM|nr:hypothetical protein [Desulfosporosinus hippei]SDG87298.1 hypothetical protein SAMN05443529_10791 [Desulfosporosinus hippei DSM 8344]
MRWLWRLFTILVFLGLARTIFLPQPKAFIAWPKDHSWVQVIQGELKQWQRFSQDLPASIEVEVRRLWKDFQPNSNGKQV